MTPQDIQTIRARALQIVERLGVTKREAGLLYRNHGKSALSAVRYLSGTPAYQTEGMPRATLRVFPEIGSERLELSEEG